MGDLLTNFSAPELSAYRNVFGIIPRLIVMLYTGELRLQKKTLALRQWKLAFVRGAIFAGAQLTFWCAIGFMKIATIAALGHTSDFLQCSCPFFFSAKA